MQNDPTLKLVNNHELYWLAAGITLAILPHGLRMPMWILPLSLTLILWRLGSALRKWPLPDNHNNWLLVLKIIFIIVAFIGVRISFHTLVGREAGSALLVILAGFKFLEIHHERDLYITTFLGFFVIITNFFVSETISTALYMLFTLTVLFTALITFNDRNNAHNLIVRIKIAGSLLIQAIPVMLILFLLFPRIEGPLWGLPKDAFAGKTGIDDEMEPGSISKLIQSNEVAFRVEFKGEPPKNSQLYWRGPVLWYDDGHKWSRRRVNDTGPPPIKTSGIPIEYTITMEPTGQRWLFALEMPKEPGEDGHFSNDYQLRIREPVNKRIRYHLSSYTDYHLGISNRYELQRALQLPPGFHNRAISLAESWRSQYSDPGKIIERALNMFNQEHFFYTLTPPLLTGDNVDDFLFNTRKGFCEHYAGAFVVLMRAAGIPARVVMGYQGGKLNPVGNYFIIQQHDAHAWAEVWLEKKGWVRIDPTSAVAPERVENGIDSALPNEINDVPAIFTISRFSRNFWQDMQNTWDAINNQWIQWVITYGPERQELVLKKLGIENINFRSLAVVLVIVVCIMFVIIALWIFRQHEPSRDRARIIYDKFCHKLHRIGLSRYPHEGPADYASRISKFGKILSDHVNEITDLYISVRYGNEHENIGILKEKVRSFRPARLVKKKRY